MKKTVLCGIVGTILSLLLLLYIWKETGILFISDNGIWNGWSSFSLGIFLSAWVPLFYEKMEKSH
jgi:hypothetical protein